MYVKLIKTKCTTIIFENPVDIVTLSLGFFFFFHKMKFDDVLREVGDFGTYQRVLFTVLCLPTVFMAMHYMAPVFIMATPDHRFIVILLFSF